MFSLLCHKPASGPLENLLARGPELPVLGFRNNELLMSNAHVDLLESLQGSTARCPMSVWSLIKLSLWPELRNKPFGPTSTSSELMAGTYSLVPRRRARVESRSTHGHRRAR